MEKQKIALVTGVTGGIGGAFAKFLIGLGYLIFAPVRNEAKALEIFGDNPSVTFEECDLENDEAVLKYIQNVAKEGIVFDLVILAAGQFKWDNEFIGADMEEKEKNAKDELTKANLLTKATFIYALQTVYNDRLHETEIWLISSQAADFAENDPKRLNVETGYKQEGYIYNMYKIAYELGPKLTEQGMYKRVVVLKPDLIDTPGARKEFSKKTIGFDPDWPNIQSSDEYVAKSC
jgi:NAD(P)-dependent dehydrogenase (short-subunit alcohol dehydrogenase family)